MIKLKSPSRLARETFLIALGIAKFEGNLSNLDKYSVLFPDFESFSSTTKKIPELHFSRPSHDMKETHRGKEKDLISIQSPSLPKKSQHHDFDRGTPVNSRMLAIESELENDMVQLRDKLEEKNKVVAELHYELSHLHDDYNSSKSDYADCKKNLRLSERRIEYVSHTSTAIAYIQCV